MTSFLTNLNREIVNPLIGLMFAVAIVYFLYGLVVFLMSQENEEKRTEGKTHMIYGIIGITIMMGVFGILNVLLATFNIPKGQVNPEEGKVNLPDYNPTYPRIGS